MHKGAVKKTAPLCYQVDKLRFGGEVANHGDGSVIDSNI